jgi:tetratricopeptide (TPR) repeat protein
VSAARAQGRDLVAAPAHHRRGLTWFEEGDYEAAQREFEAGVRASAQPGFLLKVAACARRLGHIDDARAAYRRFLQLDPRSALRADVESALGDLAEASKPEVRAPSDSPAVERGREEQPPASLAVVRDPPPSVTAHLVSPTEPPPSTRSSPRAAWWWAVVGGTVAAVVAGVTLAWRERGGPDGVAEGTLGAIRR